MKVLHSPLLLSLAAAATGVAVDSIATTQAASSKCTWDAPPAAVTPIATTTTAPVTTPSPSSSAPLTPNGTLDVVTPVVNCASLLAADITGVGGAGSNITAATEVTKSGIAYCQVQGTMPTKIGFQVLLPVSTWTQRYMQIGCGGLCGSISMSVGAADGSQDVANGNFALASTDMAGGSDGTFGLDNDRAVAFAYRAVHLTALASKKLIREYYGQPHAYAYFNGCSDGGREAVMEALRYPDEFDGIIAGAPAMLFQLQNSLHHGWLAASNKDASGKGVLLTSRLSVLHAAVLQACDVLDGLEDGLLSDPRLCNFDPASIQCASDDAAADTSACLTSAEVRTATKFYKGPTDPVTGGHLTVGEQQYGSELAWAGVCVGSSANASVMSESIALAALRYLVFADGPHANFTIADLKFERATLEKLRPRHALFDAVSPDLAPFKAAGGKLILWHGWADPHISPRTTIRLHEGLVKHMGAPSVDAFERLYLLPGVYHCGNGEGMSSIDLVTPMLQWVEAGVAPGAVMTKDAAATGGGGEGDFGQWKGSGSKQGNDGPPAGVSMPAAARALRSQASSPVAASTSTSTSSLAAASVSRSRPVYPYPAVAKYTGSGNASDAANYVAGEPLYTNVTAAWDGDDFFSAYTPVEKA